MPRQQTTPDKSIPLFVIPHVIMQKIRRHGEALERVIVRKSGSHHYNISIRTRPVKRELRSLPDRSGTNVPVISEEEGGAA